MRTVEGLLEKLRAGGVGCLRGGTYSGSVSITRGGTAKRRLTIMSAPGSRATIRGRVEIDNPANYVTVANVTITGSAVDEQTFQVYGDFAVLRGSDITNDHRTGSCIQLGSRRYGTAIHPVVVRDRIHGCGATEFEHGIYADSSRNGLITRNYIYDVPGWGVHLYKDADHTLVKNNVIDGSGESGVIFGGDETSEIGCASSDNNLVTRNIISFNAKYGIDHYWGCKVGTGNVVSHNCLWHNGKGSYDPDREGVAERANRVANPRYVDHAKHDFRLRRSTGCAGMGPSGR